MYLAGTKRKWISIVKKYRVAMRTDGKDTSYIQQYRLIRIQDKDKPDPRQTNLDDLYESISTCTSQGRGVVLMIEMDSSLENRTLDQFLARTGL